MSEKTKTVGVRMTPETKERYEEFLETEEGMEWSSISHLMRFATNRLIAGDMDDSGVDTEEIMDSVEIAMSDISEQLDEMDRELTVVSDSVRDDDEVRSLATQIYDLLPMMNDGDEFKMIVWDNPRSNHPNLPDDPRPKIDTLERARKWSDTRAWADYLDESMETTQRALSWMSSQYPDVGVVENPDKQEMRRYYREKQ